MTRNSHSLSELAERDQLHDELLAVMTQSVSGDDPHAGMKFRLSSQYLADKSLVELHALQANPSLLQ